MKSYNKKIIIFALALLILAGIIVVVLKGFNVSLDLRSHATLKFVFDTKFEKKDVENICKEVFGDKEYKIKQVEVFSDAVYIISPTITDTEKEALLTKLNDLYHPGDEVKSSTKTTDEASEAVDNTDEISQEENTENNKTIYDELVEGTDYASFEDNKVRIRDIVKPYIKPSLISMLIIFIYIAIRYKKIHNGNILLTIVETFGEMLVVLLSILSVIAITRIPFTSALIPILMFIDRKSVV